MLFPLSRSYAGSSSRGADPNAACDIDYTHPTVYRGRKSSYPGRTTLAPVQYAQHSHNGHLVLYASLRADASEATDVIRLLHDEYNKPLDDILFQDPQVVLLPRPVSTRISVVLAPACKNGNVSVARTLLELGADPSKACVRYEQSVGPSPRQAAADYGWSIFGDASS